MRNLKRKITHHLTISPVGPKDGRPTESRTFKRDIQLLERTIFAKIEEKPVSRGNLRAEVMEQEAATIERLSPQWDCEQVDRLIRRVYQLIARENNNQYRLPGFPILPIRITINKTQRALAAAKCPDVCAYLETEERKYQDSPRILQLRALADLMRKYARGEPEITVREVCEREAE